MSGNNGKTRRIAQAVYILYLASMLVAITGLAGLILAYVHRDKTEDWLQSHFRFQIRTFWIGLLYSVIGVFMLPNHVLLLFVLGWLILRCARGLKWLDEGEPVPDPATWLW